MKDLVFYTILSCLQIPIVTWLAHLLIANKEKPDKEGWHYEIWRAVTTLVVIIYVVVLFWKYGFFINETFALPQRVLMPSIITVCCTSSAFIAYHVCIKWTEKKQWATRDSAKGAFLTITIYAAVIVASAWWFFNH